MKVSDLMGDESQSLMEASDDFQHGKPVAFHYMKNTEKAPYMPNNEFGQDIEPAGDYISYYDPSWRAYEKNKEQGITQWVFGQIEFKHPYVIRDNISTGPTGWKKDLSDVYNGLVGKKLSKALMKDGYDGIIVYDTKYDEPAEIVNLNGKKTPYE